MVTVVFYELDRLVGLLLIENPFPVLDTLNQNFIDRFDPFTGPNTPRHDRVVVFENIIVCLLIHHEAPPILKLFSSLLAVNIRSTG